MDPLAVSAYGAEQALPLTGTGNGRGDPVEVVNSGVDLGVDLTISF